MADCRKVRDVDKIFLAAVIITQVIDRRSLVSEFTVRKI